MSKSCFTISSSRPSFEIGLRNADIFSRCLSLKNHEFTASHPVFKKNKNAENRFIANSSKIELSAITCQYGALTREQRALITEFFGSGLPNIQDGEVIKINSENSDDSGRLYYAISTKILDKLLKKRLIRKKIRKVEIRSIVNNEY